MGMSASQARFLSLTARKNNVEFEGQQINQQRTTLSNQSASYYSELCNMTVPTPPSVDDYTKICYTFNDGSLSNTITSMIAKSNNEYSINFIQQWQDDFSIVSSASSLISKTDDDKYKIGSSTLRKLGSEIPENTKTVAGKININGENFDVTQKDDGYYINETQIVAKKVQCTKEDIENFKYFLRGEDDTLKEVTKSEDNKYYSGEEELKDITEDDLIICLQNEKESNNPNTSVILVEKGEDDQYYKEEFEEKIQPRKLTDKEVLSITSYSDSYLSTLTPEQIAQLQEQETYYKTLLNAMNGNPSSDDDWYVRYVKNSSTGAYVPYFYKASNVENPENYTQGYANINCYTVGSSVKTKEVMNRTASVEKDSTGRYIAITLYETAEDGTVDKTKSVTYSLTTNTVTDEDAYNDAMNKYKYEQAQYDKKIQEINSKLEIVQQQDKSLELNLKQLDTEEQAIQTEIDAVKKVISKNVDSTFKTFSA